MIEGISSEEILHPLLLSTKVVGLSATLFLVFGVFVAYKLANTNSSLKWVIESIVTIPLIFPPIAVGYLLLLLLGRSSPFGGFLYDYGINFIFDFKGLVLAAFIAGLPLMVKPLQSAIEQFPDTIKEASYLSGKSKFATLIFIILPTIKKSLIAALLTASARALGEVGITLMLGGDVIGKTDTISLAIYNAVFDGNNTLAMTLCMILIFISLLIFFALNQLERKNTQRI